MSLLGQGFNLGGFGGEVGGGAPAVENEDLTTYTYGGNDVCTITADSCTFTNLNRTHNTYLYKDFSAGYFGDFEIQFDFIMSACATSHVSFFVQATNTLPPANLMIAANDGLGMYIWNNAGTVLWSDSCQNTDNVDTYTMSLSTQYYATIDRSGTTLRIRIYSDASRETLVDTLSITCEAGTKRYLVVLTGRNDATSALATGVIENVKIVTAS